MENLLVRSSVIVEELIDLGRNDVVGIPPSLYNEAIAWKSLMVGKQPWISLAESLSEQRLRLLIKGLMLYGQAPGRYTGGSASPVIDLYKNFVSRFPKSEPELTRWIVANRRDDYVPFGTIVHGNAQTYAEFSRFRHLRNKKRELSEARQEAKTKRLRAIRKFEKTKLATQRLAAAVRRGDVCAVEALLGKGADWRKALPDGGSLVDLAEKNGRTAMAGFLQARGIG